MKLNCENKCIQLYLFNAVILVSWLLILLHSPCWYYQLKYKRILEEKKYFNTHNILQGEVIESMVTMAQAWTTWAWSWLKSLSFNGRDWIHVHAVFLIRNKAVGTFKTGWCKISVIQSRNLSTWQRHNHLTCNNLKSSKKNLAQIIFFFKTNHQSIPVSHCWPYRQNNNCITIKLKWTF